MEKKRRRKGFITGDCEDKRILMHDSIDTKNGIHDIGL